MSKSKKIAIVVTLTVAGIGSIGPCLVHPGPGCGLKAPTEAPSTPEPEVLDSSGGSAR